MQTAPLRWLAVLCLTSFAISQDQAKPSPQSLATEADQRAIQQIEDALVKGENTPDPAVFDRVLADDYETLNPGGPGPGKAQIVKGLQAHAGQPSPYSVEERDMHIYILGNTAVAACVRTYTAKANGNLAREDKTHVFTKDHGTWKLRFSRASIRKED